MTNKLKTVEEILTENVYNRFEAYNVIKEDRFHIASLLVEALEEKKQTHHKQGECDNWDDCKIYSRHTESYNNALTLAQTIVRELLMTKE